MLRLLFNMSCLARGGGVLFMTGGGTMGGGSVRFVELFGAIGAVKFMAFARHGKHGNSHQQDRE